MAAKDFTTTILVDQSPKEVFNAVNNVGGWWQGEITGNTAQLDDEFSYRMKDIHYSKQRLIELIPNKKVVWFHCASLGEFDQGLPVMNLMKERDHEIFLLPLL